MKGINRRSQKVRCLAEFELIDTTSGRAYQGPIPQIDEVYTVGDFSDCNGLLDENDVDLSNGETVPGIVLVELKSPIGRRPDGSRRPVGWPIVGFEPLVEGEQDISALVEAANRTDLLTPADEIMRAFERVTGSPLPEREPVDCAPIPYW